MIKDGVIYFTHFDGSYWGIFNKIFMRNYESETKTSTKILISHHKSMPMNKNSFVGVGTHTAKCIALSIIIIEKWTIQQLVGEEEENNCASVAIVTNGKTR